MEKKKIETSRIAMFFLVLKYIVTAAGAKSRPYKKYINLPSLNRDFNPFRRGVILSLN